MIEPNFVENAAPMLIERLDELGRIDDLLLPLKELRELVHNTPAYALLASGEYGQLILDRARELIHMNNP